MATKSPTSVRLREVIGVNQFSQRREVFDKHDTVFLPLPSPTSMVPAHREGDPITSAHGNATNNFKRNAPGYSSMRESRTEDRDVDFRPRKYSDNFTSELNQSEDVDYRYSMTERTRRLSKLRREFLNSNLHEPTYESPFARTGIRASMPASASVIKYKIESPNLYKFPFAEPYATPPSVRKVVLDLGPVEVNGEKENKDPEAKHRHRSLPNNNTSPTVDRQKFFEELVKRYSPQRKPVDWKLPPTKPRVVGSVPKSISSAADSIDGVDKKIVEEAPNKYEDDDVFDEKLNKIEAAVNIEKSTNSVKEIFNESQQKAKEKSEENALKTENGPEIVIKEPNKKTEVNKGRDSKTSLTELEEKNDEVPELSNMQRQSRESAKRPSLEKYTDLTIPALIEKMTEEAEDSEIPTKEPKKPAKIKRKRSFLDKLLGRKKKE